MQRHYKLSVPNISSRTRLDKYITQFIENASRTKVQKCINLGTVLVNGNCVKSNYMLKPYDEIEIELPVPEKIMQGNIEGRLQKETSSLYRRPLPLVYYRAG